MREKGEEKCDRFIQSKQIFHVFLSPVWFEAFLFHHNGNSRKKPPKASSRILHKYIYVYKHILLFLQLAARDERENMCNSSRLDRLIIEFYWYFFFTACWKKISRLAEEFLIRPRMRIKHTMKFSSKTKPRRETTTKHILDFKMFSRKKIILSNWILKLFFIVLA